MSLVSIGVGLAAIDASLSVGAHERCRRIDTDRLECSPEPERDESDLRPRLNEAGSFEMHFAFVSVSPFLASRRFTGSGTPIGGTGKTSFSASGRELGYVHPRAYGGEVAAAYLRRWVRFGGFFGFSMLSPDANATSADAAMAVNGASMKMLHVGLDAALILPLDRVRLGLGAAFGAYLLDLPLHGFEKTPGGSKDDPHPSANAIVGFVQPRLSLDVDLVPGHAVAAASLGGFVGIDVANENSITWGATLSFHEPQTSLAP